MALTFDTMPVRLCNNICFVLIEIIFVFNITRQFALASSMVTRPATPTILITTIAIWLRWESFSKMSVAWIQDKHGGTQHFLNIKTLFLGMVPQQILSEQYSYDLIFTAIGYWEARMTLLDDKGMNSGGFLTDIDGIHMGTRNHDVANLHSDTLHLQSWSVHPHQTNSFRTQM